MSDLGTETAATSAAATRATEPGVVAAIASAEGSPDLPTRFRIAGGPGLGHTLLLLGAGLAIGYGIGRVLRSR